MKYSRPSGASIASNMASVRTRIIRNDHDFCCGGPDEEDTESRDERTISGGSTREREQ